MSHVQPWPGGPPVSPGGVGIGESIVSGFTRGTASSYTSHQCQGAHFQIPAINPGSVVSGDGGNSTVTATTKPGPRVREQFQI